MVDKDMFSDPLKRATRYVDPKRRLDMIHNYLPSGELAIVTSSKTDIARVSLYRQIDMPGFDRIKEFSVSAMSGARVLTCCDNKLASLYDAIRSSGALFKATQTNPNIVNLSDVNLASYTLRSEDYHNGLCEMGRYFFPSVRDLFGCQGLPMKIDCIVMGGLQSGCLRSNSFNYNHETDVIWVDNVSNRKAVTVSSVPAVPSVFNTHFNQIKFRVTRKPEILATALGFGKANANELEPIMDHMVSVSGANLVKRAVVGWLMIIRAKLLGLDTVRVLTSGNIYELYCIPALVQVVNALDSIDDTCCIYAKGQSVPGAVFLASLTKSYPNEDAHELYLGGKMIPAEGNKTYVLSGHPTSQFNRYTTGYVDVSVTECYNALTSYFLGMDKLTDLCDGLSLACALLSHSGDYNFSLPWCSSMLDLVASAIGVEPTGGYVPGMDIPDHLIMGAVALDAQIRVMLCDIGVHTSYHKKDLISSKWANDKVKRDDVYGFFMRERFSDAFNICYVIDPLNDCRMDEEVYQLSVFQANSWSIVNQSVILSNTFSQIMVEGYWSGIEKLAAYDEVTSLRIRMTLLLCACLEGDEYVAMHELANPALMEGGVTMCIPQISLIVSDVSPASYDDWTVVEPPTMPTISKSRDDDFISNITGMKGKVSKRNLKPVIKVSEDLVEDRALTPESVVAPNLNESTTSTGTIKEDYNLGWLRDCTEEFLMTATTSTLKKIVRTWINGRREIPVHKLLGKLICVIAPAANAEYRCRAMSYIHDRSILLNLPYLRLWGAVGNVIASNTTLESELTQHSFKQLSPNDVQWIYCCWERFGFVPNICTIKYDKQVKDKDIFKKFAKKSEISLTLNVDRKCIADLLTYHIAKFYLYFLSEKNLVDTRDEMWTRSGVRGSIVQNDYYEWDQYANINDMQCKLMRRLYPNFPRNDG